MGTDIHWHVEVKGEDGAWREADRPDECKPEWWKPRYDDPDPEDGRPRIKPQWWIERNYTLFAILAGVRNGYGFARVPTGDTVDPITKDRGLPCDAAADYSEHVDHSANWLTLAEIMAHDWDKTTEKCGVIRYDEFMLRAATSRRGQPEQYCGGVSGAGIVVIDEDDKLSLEKRLRIDGDTDKVYIRTRWIIKHRDHCGEFLNVIVPAMQRLGKPEDVRAVFWFDS